MEVWACWVISTRNCERWTELLDPAQDGSPAHVDATVSQDASDPLSGGAQRQVVADGQEDDVTRETLVSYQTHRLTGRVSATGTTGPQLSQARTARPRWSWPSRVRSEDEQ